MFSPRRTRSEVRLWGGLSADEPSTVTDERLTSDERAVRGGQEPDGVRDVLGASPSPDERERVCVLFGGNVSVSAVDRFRLVVFIALAIGADV
jgi:hypothetical protein